MARYIGAMMVGLCREEEAVQMIRVRLRQPSPSLHPILLRERRAIRRKLKIRISLRLVLIKVPCCIFALGLICTRSTAEDFIKGKSGLIGNKPAVSTSGRSSPKKGNEKPTVAETIAWMNLFLDQHSNNISVERIAIVGNGQGHCNYRRYNKDNIEIHWEQIKSKYLRLDVENVDGPYLGDCTFTEGIEEHRPVTKSRTEMNIPLEDVLLTEILPLPKEEKYTFKRDDELLTHTDVYANPEMRRFYIKSRDNSNSIIIYFDTLESAQRFKKAFDYLREMLAPSKIKEDLF